MSSRLYRSSGIASRNSGVTTSWPSPSARTVPVSGSYTSNSARSAHRCRRPSGHSPARLPVSVEPYSSMTGTPHRRLIRRRRASVIGSPPTNSARSAGKSISGRCPAAIAAAAQIRHSVGTDQVSVTSRSCITRTTRAYGIASDRLSPGTTVAPRSRAAAWARCPVSSSAYGVRTRNTSSADMPIHLRAKRSAKSVQSSAV